MELKQYSDQRAWRMRMLLLHGAMLATPVALLIAHSRFHVNALGICVFKAISGVDCPACGITHSAMAMVSGHMRDAFRLHPAGPMVVVIVGIMVLYLAVVLWTGYEGVQWKKESTAYNTLERLAIGVLLIGWVGKLFMN